jgi:hypothetical protein
MASYRLFEKNPVTNEWVDRGWKEGDGQKEVLRANAVQGSEYFAVPATSFHPVRLSEVTVTRWEFSEDGAQEEMEDVPEKVT